MGNKLKQKYLHMEKAGNPESNDEKIFRCSCCLLHGDLHAGSVMVSPVHGEIRIIDPEFAIYGPCGLDLGSLLFSFVFAIVYHYHAADTNLEARARQKITQNLLLAIQVCWMKYFAILERPHNAKNDVEEEIGTSGGGKPK